MAYLRWTAVARRAFLVWTTAASIGWTSGCFSEESATTLSEESGGSDAGTTAGFTATLSSSTSATQGTATSDTGTGVDATEGSATSGSTGDSSGSSTGGGCEGVGECDDRIACTFDTCEDGRCDHSPLDGVDAPPEAQTDEDCLLVVCVDGNDVAIDDDADLYDDTNVCTDDLCVLGVPSNPPLPLGTECNRTGQCDGDGSCSECLSPDDCDQLPVDDDCQMRTCEGGMCGHMFATQGVEVNGTLQTPGDCQLVVCDGAGATESIDDDGDLPVDGLPCTDDVCNAGTPSNPDLPSGTPCGMNGMCNMTGDCVGCFDPDDCGGMSTFCQAITCIGNLCGVDNTDAGTPLPQGSQEDGDCQELRCDGDGAVMPSIDMTDVPPDDGNDCTGEACNGGTPHHPDLPVGSACNDNGGAVCDGSGGCVECIDTSDCPAAPPCQQATCTNNECGLANLPMGTSCNDGTFCNGTDTCGNAGQCVSSGNPCMGADGDGNCAESCNEAVDNCMGPDPNGTVCNDSLFCTVMETCQAGACTGMGNPCDGPDGDMDCSETCDENANNCNGNDPNGTMCDDLAFCSVMSSCSAGQCVGNGNPCDGVDGDNDCSEMCNEVTNQCNGNDPQGSGCADMAFCTTNEQCNGMGQCLGTDDPCPGPDGDEDCRESCSETNDNCLAPDATGSACDDQFFCTDVDTCNQFGNCVGAGDPCPQEMPNTGCKEGCNEDENDCSAAEPFGRPCEDGFFCTLGDECDGGGGCIGGNGSPCPGPDGDGDCTESCSEFAGDCIAGDPVGSPCDDDGLFCTGEGQCTAQGECDNVGMDKNPCDGPDGDANCAESCDEGADVCCAQDPEGSACVGSQGNGTCTGGCCSAQGGPCAGPCI